MSPEQKIVAKIMASTKYHFVGQQTVERIVSHNTTRYGIKRAEDESKRLLHQIWGIYYDTISPKVRGVADLQTLLTLHRSTKERLPFLREFYEAIFAITGQPKIIIDYACGLNPLAFASLALPFPAKYHAFDIDTLTTSLLTQWFTKLGVQDRFTAKVGDVLNDQPTPGDIALLLKVLPPLELQQKGSSLQVIEKQQTRFVVVSYPTKSVSGKEKGMANFYSEQFRGVVKGQPWKVSELVFANELVFVVEKPALKD